MFWNDDVDSVVIILQNLIEDSGMIFKRASDENLVVSNEERQVFVSYLDSIMFDNRDGVRSRLRHMNIILRTAA